MLRIVSLHLPLTTAAAQCKLPVAGELVSNANASHADLRGMQAIESCSYDVPAALQRFQAERLPEFHAMHELDLSVDARFGMRGKLHPEFLVNMATFLFWGTLAKIFPGVKLPPGMAADRASAPFTKVSAHRRDSCCAVHSQVQQIAGRVC